MKRFRYFFLALAALSLAVACTQKEEPFQPGDPDVSGCYGVYFPVQEAAGAHTYDPTMPTTVEFTVKRTNSSGAITVPVKYTESETGAFQVGTLSFADGQEETTLKVDFPNTGIGTTYSLSLLVDDPQYASQYNDGAVSIDFSVLRVEWIEMKDPKTKETALVTFTNKQWNYVAEAKLKYYEVDGVRTCETFDEKIVSSNMDLIPAGNKGIFGCGENNHLHFTWYVKSGNIDVPKQYMGFNYNDGDWQVADEGVGDPIYVYDWFNYYITDGGYAGSWPDWETFLEKNPGAKTRSSYDGNGGFMLTVRYYIPGLGGWSPADDSLVGIVSGYTRVDYSIAMELDYVQDDVLPVYFETGADVAEIKVAGYPGELTATQVGNKVSDIADGKEENAISVSTADFEVDEETGIKYGATGLTFDESGVYTVVAVSFDKDGKPHESASATHSYVAAADVDKYAVKFNVGAEATPSRFDGEEYDAKTSFAFYVYGEDITEAHVGIFDASKYNKAVDDYQAEVKLDEDETYALDADAIAAVNAAGGYYDVVTGCAPNTEYVVLVWATNGNEEAFKTATFKTDGLPNEIIAADGCFGYLIAFNEEEGVEYFDYVPLEYNPNNGNYEIHNWGYGTTFTFTYDEETGEIDVPRQATGFANGTYGTLFVGAPTTMPQSWIDYFQPDLEKKSYVDEDGNFHFYLSYYSSAGYYFGTGYEVYYVNGEPSDEPSDEPGDEPGDDEGGEEGGEGEGGEEGGEGEGGEESTSSVGAAQLHVGVSRDLQDARRSGHCYEREANAVNLKVVNWNSKQTNTVSTVASRKDKAVSFVR
ncbi:MAG: hypothetical protein J5577_07990 [Bacteroidales bacterium]|nr:hypothetical protein [Bacteroidales bacterium]MBR4817393.1 hypothetical protein [Bacteroidales bacterium]MBR5054801.1 hypothetical protein [Bacteroidales bacterium]